MDRFFGLDSVSKQDEALEHVCTVYSTSELAVVRSILDGADIPYLIKERGAGASVKIITGFSMYGTDIFVPTEAAQTAKELLCPADADTKTEDTEK